MKFYLFNEGVCIRLKLFGEEIKELLTKNGYEESNLEDADLILINSCSFLKSKEEFFLKKIEEVNNLENKKVCVFGCLPSANTAGIKKINKDILLAGRNIEEISRTLNLKHKKTSIAYRTKKELSRRGKIIFLLNKLILNDKAINYRLNKEEVFHLNISKGCLGKCTYCQERFTTKFKSKKISEVISIFERGLKEKNKIFSLNSDDTSCFGIDNNESTEQLLRKILSYSEQFYLTITEFNPKRLNKNIIELLSSNKIIFITLPIQSGSQRILNRMGREYKIKDTIKKIKQIKKLNPSIKINTHFIVGFPGETKKDFEKTLDLVDSGLFDRIKVFEYNDRPLAIATKMKNKVSEEEKNYRKEKLKRRFLISQIKKLNLSNILMELAG